MSNPLFLRIYKGDELLQVKQTKSDQVVLGREGEVDVVLEGDKIAPIHAMVEKREGGYFLCDLGSEEGTFLGGARVLDQPIESGDEFQIGDYRIEFFVGIPKPMAKPPSLTPPPDPSTKDDVYDRRLDEEVEGPSKLDEPEEETKVLEEPPSDEEIPVEDPPSESEPEEESEVIELESEEPKPIEKIKSPPPSPPKSQPIVMSVAKGESSSKTSGVVGGGGVETVRPGSDRSAPIKGTFAPPSEIKNVREILKPMKGTVVEVVVTWKERVLNSYHFGHRKTITVGAHPKNDIILPVFGSANVSHPLVRIDQLAMVFITSDMTGELIRGDVPISFSDLIRQGKAKKSGSGHLIRLEQGEMAQIDLRDGVSIFVRYVSSAPKPLPPPLLDLSVNEISTMLVIMAFVLISSLYVSIYSPDEVEEAVEETPKKALFVYKKPKQKIIPVEKKTVVAVDMTKTTKKAAVKAVSKPKVKKTAMAPRGKAVEAKPNKSKSKVKKLTASKAGKGKGIKLGANKGKGKSVGKQGSKTAKDVTKSGILSAFGTKGTQDKLEKAYEGSGAVGGLSKSAKGRAGTARGSGTTPGSGLKNIGKGGKGVSAVGIAGVGTKGRGGGTSNYGKGSSLGTHKSATIVPGGEEESFSGSIDKEAIRRVIMQNMKQIKACYERALNKDPALHGKLVLQWTIGDRGRVTEGHVKTTTLKSREVEQCCISRLKTWRFPEPPVDQEAVVVYPFVFTAQN